MTTHQPGPDDLYPMLRADNAEVDPPLRPQVRSAAAGGQGTGKTSALLAFFINDVEDPDAAPIVIDPKSELSRICLRIRRPTAANASGSSTSAARRSGCRRCG